MLSAFIDDGYTEDVELEEIPGIAPKIAFSFRPMTAGEMGEFVHSSEKMTESEVRKAIAERLAAKITAWDVRSAKGDTVERTAANMAKLKEQRFLSLWRVVKGDVPGKPQAQADDSKN